MPFQSLITAPRRATIVVDAFNAQMAKGTGIATYARNLVSAASTLGHRVGWLAEPQREAPAANPGVVTAELRAAAALFGLTATQGEGSRDWSVDHLFKTASRSYRRYGRFTDVRFPTTGDLPPPDIMHWTCPLPLRAKGAANLYTLHDLIPLKLKGATRDDPRRFETLCRRICATADHVITVSEASKADIISHFGIEADRVTNTYQSVEMPPSALERSDEAIAEEIEQEFGLPWRGYFLFFGAIEPKKNVKRLLEAYLASGVGAPLVVVGSGGWMNAEELAILDRHAARRAEPGAGLGRGDMLHLPYLSGDVLAHLVRGAKATLFPSLNEGFGLPVLESMLLRTPVLTSWMGALREVAGDAAVIVDPYDVASIASGIRTLDEDTDLRGHLTAAGYENAQRFSPAAYADRLADLYASLGLSSDRKGDGP